MACIPRVTVPSVSHHVTQRGNRRQPVFFQDADFREYLRLLGEQSQRYGLRIWAYCLMTNHVHLVVVPEREDSLTRAIGETHRRYTRYVNFQKGWRGYLWQGRFASFPLDEPHLYAAVRYVERNPVQARLVQPAEAYPWSSAQAHVARIADPVLSPSFLIEQILDWKAFLRDAQDDALGRVLDHHSSIGRPLGDEAFLTHLEHVTGRLLRRRRPGPKPILQR